jgi:hypothetical protein
MSLEELKAQAYDILALIEQGRAKLQEINLLIAKEYEKNRQETQVSKEEVKS